MYEVTLFVKDLNTRYIDAATARLSQSSLDDLLLSIKRNYPNVLCVDDDEFVIFEYNTRGKKLTYRIEKC